MRRARLLPLLALAAVGCGLVDDDLPPAAPSLGLAAWESLGPVTFCDGDLRLGPPSSRVAGFCAAGPGAPCAVDADCGDRQRCACGRCRLPACDSGDECPAGWVCSFADRRCDRPCAGDGECRAGERCLAGQGVCRGDCASGAACGEDETCVAGLCVARPCADDGACAAGTCAVQRVPADLRHPSPTVGAPPASTVTLWLERRTDGRAAIWRAVSDDGMAFRLDPARPVIEPDERDGGRAGAPAVLARSDGLLLVYANALGHLRRATSVDGASFLVAPDPLALPAGAWTAVDTPALAATPAGLALSFAAVDGSAIGLGRSPDGLAFSVEERLTLRPRDVTSTAWRDVSSLASPFLLPSVDADGVPRLSLLFAARGRELPDGSEFGQPVPTPENASIGLAVSVADQRFSPWPHGPVLARRRNLLTRLAEEEPAVADLGDRRLLYFRDPAETLSSSLWVAAAR